MFDNNGILDLLVVTVIIALLEDELAGLATAARMAYVRRVSDNCMPVNADLSQQVLLLASY